jgi:hypothetical protein
MAPQPRQPKPKWVDDPTCRDVFADSVVVRASTDGRIVRLEFCAFRYEAGTSQPTSTTPVARIVLTTAEAASLFQAAQRVIAAAQVQLQAPRTTN